VVEGARLESVYTGNRIAGSNPAPSAISHHNLLIYKKFIFLLILYPNSAGVVGSVLVNRLRDSDLLELHRLFLWNGGISYVFAYKMFSASSLI
jgi:hypothetical protein